MNAVMEEWVHMAEGYDGKCIHCKLRQVTRAYGLCHPCHRNIEVRKQYKHQHAGQCRHCAERHISRAYGLCRKCHINDEVRKLYKPPREVRQKKPKVRQLCVHCRKTTANRPRSLCWACYNDMSIRNSIPSRGCNMSVIDIDSLTHPHHPYYINREPITQPWVGDDRDPVFEEVERVVADQTQKILNALHKLGPNATDHQIAEKVNVSVELVRRRMRDRMLADQRAK